MTEKDIVTQIESYFKQQKQFGDVIYFDKLKNTVLKTALEATDIKSIKNVVIDAETDLFEPVKSWKHAESISELKILIEDCLNCPLGHTRTNFVFGSGNPNADIMIIGEAPGADEDMQGLPFVGRAGQLLTKILEAINLKREEVFICNILKCRPPQNRPPLPTEVEQCEPYLKKQIELIKPAFILALGLTAIDTLLKSKHKMGEMRGKVLNYHGIKMLVTYHPSALLRNPDWKKQTWDDVKLLRRMYDEYLKNK